MTVELDEAEVGRVCRIWFAALYGLGPFTVSQIIKNWGGKENMKVALKGTGGGILRDDNGGEAFFPAPWFAVSVPRRPLAPLSR